MNDEQRSSGGGEEMVKGEQGLIGSMTQKSEASDADEGVQQSEAEAARELYTDPDEVIRLAKEDDMVIDFCGRWGARPYMKFTPYRNNRGVKIHMWSCISYMFKAMPGRALLGRPKFVWPDEIEGYEVASFTDEWVWSRVFRSRGVVLIPVEESPFAGGVIGGWLDE